MNPRIEQRIAPLVVAPQMLLTPATKEIVAGAALGGARVNRTPRQVIRTGVDGYAVSVEHTPPSVLIVIVGNLPHCGLNRILQVAKKRQSSPPTLVWNTQKLDTVVDGKLPEDMYSASIFSKVIGNKLSGNSKNDLYLRWKTNFAADPIQT